ncbi:aldehyde dehydrogenase family protein [Lentibacter algarum]|uniref:aldehyde dehydrogenase family protein n=1 Tax=Lentibacter algarum TaxID=576131 RepID=UPI001C08BA65|nr:aldehyde dehydrogenase family protein [Lentibacter algarum]MBU2983706.1 aldehyde dehydrogenase family protein [Lentibacter algarum]
MTDLLGNARRFYINGEWCEPVGDTIIPVINPATEVEIAKITLGNSSDVERAVSAAAAASATYKQTTKSERLDLLRRFRAAYVERYEEMAQTISAELGAPIDMAREQQTETGLGHLDAFIDALEAHEDREVLANGDTLLFEPIGVCALITPWNWPVNQIALKVIPALATGCTCILKPSEITPLSAVVYAEMLDAAGVPPGVFNLIQGDGVGVGTSLTTHPEVDMVSFTGSTRAGIAISKAASETVKRVSLELGGKSPSLIFADADLKAAIASTVNDCMNNTGQSCDAPTRLLVEQSVHDEVVAMAAEMASAIEIGDPSMMGKHIGPLVSDLQLDRVLTLINVAIAEGAQLVAGGPKAPDAIEAGYYIEPTVFAQVGNDMRIAQEEVFGPVLVIIPFQTEDEAVKIANTTPYGLAAYLHTTDEVRQERLIRNLRAGMVHVNGGEFKYGSPFGGYRMSGNSREGGSFGLDDFLEVKAVHR